MLANDIYRLLGLVFSYYYLELYFEEHVHRIASRLPRSTDLYSSLNTPSGNWSYF